MAVSLINIGTIANDGTGDDLRDAFIKVNQNFEELDLRVPESTTASNLGLVGEGIFAQESNNQLQFKKLVAGSNITLTATDNTITVNGIGGLQNLAIVSDSGSTILSDGETLRIQGGTNVNTTLNGITNVLEINATTILQSDTSPTLSANLNAANNSIVNLSNVDSLVYNIDIRNINSYFEDLDLGNIVQTFDNWIDVLISQVGVDFGSFTSPASIEVNLGSI